MSMRIKNGGVFGAILRMIADESPELLTEEDKKLLAALDDTPRNIWIDVDGDGYPISKEQATEKEREHLSRFTTPDGAPIFPTKASQNED